MKIELRKANRGQKLPLKKLKTKIKTKKKGKK